MEVNITYAIEYVLLLAARQSLAPNYALQYIRLQSQLQYMG